MFETPLISEEIFVASSAMSETLPIHVFLFLIVSSNLKHNSKINNNSLVNMGSFHTKILSHVTVLLDTDAVFEFLKKLMCKGDTLKIKNKH